MIKNFHTKVIDEELSAPPRSLEDLDGYAFVSVLARIHGTPVGRVDLPVMNGRCSAWAIRKKILETCGGKILMVLLENALASESFRQEGGLVEVLNCSPPEQSGSFPLVTAAVCTRDRTEDLRHCLNSLIALDYPNLEMLVVDNAPASEDTARLVCDSFPAVRYIRENRPGLDWARNRAAMEAKGEIIAYTDDDVVVDPKWIAAIARIFVHCPEVMAVTGLVVPDELETEAQRLFEIYGGFGRGFNRKWSHAAFRNGNWRAPIGTGQFGTGANMAYRRRIFDLIGYFDPAMDVGTVTNGGGDLEMFFRVQKEGYSLVYEPGAIVRHRHRRDLARFKTQIRNNGIGFYSYLVRSAVAYPDDRTALMRFGLWWFWHWSLRRFLRSFYYPSRFPRDIIWAELAGSIIGLGRFPRARRHARRIAETATHTSSREWLPASPKKGARRQSPRGTAVRFLDLGLPLTVVEDVAEFDSTIFYVSHKGRILGVMSIENRGVPISILRLRQSLAEHLGLRLLGGTQLWNESLDWAEAMVALRRKFLPSMQESHAALSGGISVAVVVATYDRPDDLRECLRSLVNQKTSRRLEIIVVDNHPESGCTGPVVSDFPEILLIQEPRRGVSYARNAGVLRTKAEVIVTTDDDVIAPEDWIEKLIAPLVRGDVMAVTGNVLPYELTAPSQRLYESYGGLSRGFKAIEADTVWYEKFVRMAVPTWHLGGTANSAFRNSVFTHPEIGLFEEMLGPGMPTGCSEDTYIFYRILKNGHTILYEPEAFVWHKHRRDLSSLRQQIYNYSKGHVAYHILTFIRCRDIRAIFHLIYFLPRWHLVQLYRYFKAWIKRRPQTYPLRLIATEILGNLVGPWALCRSWWNVRRQKRTAPASSTQQKERDAIF